MCLRIKFCNHQRPRRAKLLKSLYPSKHMYYGTRVNTEDRALSQTQREERLREKDVGRYYLCVD
jgi:hypothetical protein